MLLVSDSSERHTGGDHTQDLQIRRQTLYITYHDGSRLETQSNRPMLWTHSLFQIEQTHTLVLS